MFIDTNANIYTGDMRTDDREATSEEVAAWELSRLPKPLDEIRAIESRPEVVDAMEKATRQFLLGAWFAKVKAMPAAASMTDEQIEAYCRGHDATYKALAEAEDAIKALRGKV